MKRKTRHWTRLTTVVLAMVFSLWPAAARAGAATVVPVGRAVGIKLFSDGVVVVGTSEVVTEGGRENPAKACGLREGDIITHINSTEVDTIEEVTAMLQQLEGESMSIRAIRDDRTLHLTARGVFCPADSSYKLGALIRDSMAGIGTVTYYCPETGAFGALGHGINDVDTQLLMPMESGAILPARVSGVQKGRMGAPGQLKGVFSAEPALGELEANTASGVFGTLSAGSELGGLAVETAERTQVKAGDATILSNVSGDAVEEYAIRILKVYPASAAADGRDFLIEVTDRRLLEATGGIVQGMSGSPIMQNGRLVGAVTHVLVDDPTRGYGIFIGNMLNAAG
ncbi:MAG: SpoIVB peptidase [Oscillospiraceae bacterium]|nr:SpoIVB peptidase [Oscillospiraceae bacterium]